MVTRVEGATQITEEDSTVMKLILVGLKTVLDALGRRDGQMALPCSVVVLRYNLIPLQELI